MLRQIDHAVNNSGVKAGRFFQFSYECLGSVSCIVLLHRFAHLHICMYVPIFIVEEHFGHLILLI